ncbi:MAG: hypothetical protein WDN27_04570 [Candidatus Saccharibacteria bacterium]
MTPPLRPRLTFTSDVATVSHVSVSSNSQPSPVDLADNSTYDAVDTSDPVMHSSDATSTKVPQEPVASKHATAKKSDPLIRDIEVGSIVVLAAGLLTGYRIKNSD